MPISLSILELFPTDCFYSMLNKEWNYTTLKAMIAFIVLL